MTSSRSQVEVTGGAAGRVSTPHVLALASAALLLILLVASATLSMRAYVLYMRADSATSGVIRAGNSLLISLLNAETGQRGYLLTNQPIYLEPYNRALSMVSAAQRRLGSRVSAVPGGRQYFVELHNLAAVKMAELAKTINLARAGNHAGALRIVNTNEGKRVMDRARRVIADLDTAAAAAGALRRSDLRTQLTAFTVLAAVLAVADVSAGLFLRRRLRKSGKSVQSLNADLEQQVQQVQQRTIHLERANRNLEAFAYSVAHDLRTPYTSRIQAGCARMATLN